MDQTGDNLNCIFCKIEKERIVTENDAAFAICDGFPVSEGHMLIIPKKHFSDYFEVDQQTRDELWKLVDECKKIVDKKFV
jgi:diadenosine tetraphosphate (Ap4A) HIT family hydrolase